MFSDSIQANLRVWFDELRDAKHDLAGIETIADPVERSQAYFFCKARIGRIEMRIDKIMKEA